MANPALSMRPYGTSGLARGAATTTATQQHREAQRLERERAERAERERMERAGQSQLGELSEEQREEINEAVRLNSKFTSHKDGKRNRVKREKRRIKILI